MFSTFFENAFVKRVNRRLSLVSSTPESPPARPKRPVVMAINKKPRVSAKRTKRAAPRTRVHNVSDAMRAADDALRAELQHANLKKFDRVLAKAIRPAR
jgi:hypothetical protein